MTPVDITAMLLVTAERQFKNNNNNNTQITHLPRALINIQIKSYSEKRLVFWSSFVNLKQRIYLSTSV